MNVRRQKVLNDHVRQGLTIGNININDPGSREIRAGGRLALGTFVGLGQRDQLGRDISRRRRCAKDHGIRIRIVQRIAAKGKPAHSLDGQIIAKVCQWRKIDRQLDINGRLIGRKTAVRQRKHQQRIACIARDDQRITIGIIRQRVFGIAICIKDNLGRRDRRAQERGIVERDAIIAI